MDNKTTLEDLWWFTDGLNRKRAPDHPELGALKNLVF